MPGTADIDPTNIQSQRVISLLFHYFHSPVEPARFSADDDDTHLITIDDDVGDFDDIVFVNIGHNVASLWFVGVHNYRSLI